MLFLILSHRHMRRLIQQHVGSLQHGVSEQRDRLAFAVLARLVLPLRHAVEPAHPRRAVQQPLQFGMGRNLRLIEQHGLCRVHSAGDQRGDHFACVLRQFGGAVRLRDRVQVGKEDEAFAARCMGFILKLHIVDDSAEVIAEMRLARRLDAGNDSHFGILSL